MILPFLVEEHVIICDWEEYPDFKANGKVVFIDHERFMVENEDGMIVSGSTQDLLEDIELGEVNVDVTTVRERNLQDKLRELAHRLIEGWYQADKLDHLEDVSSSIFQRDHWQRDEEIGREALELLGEDPEEFIKDLQERYAIMEDWPEEEEESQNGSEDDMYMIGPERQYEAYEGDVVEIVTTKGDGDVSAIFDDNGNLIKVGSVGYITEFDPHSVPAKCFIQISGNRNVSEVYTWNLKPTGAPNKLRYTILSSPGYAFGDLRWTWALDENEAIYVFKNFTDADEKRKELEAANNQIICRVESILEAEAKTEHPAPFKKAEESNGE